MPSKALFFPGVGKGNFPRAKTAHDRLERKLMRLAVVRPAEPAVADQQSAMLDELEHVLARLPRQALVASPVASTAVTNCAVTDCAVTDCAVDQSVTPELFFCDAEAKPGYRPRPPRSERERLEAERQRLRLQLWSQPESKGEIEAEVERLEAELRALEGKA